MIAEAAVALALVAHRAPAMQAGARAATVSAKARARPRSLSARAGARLGTLQIPRIGVRTPIYEGTSGRVLMRGAGHYEGTGLPGGLKTIGIAGHRVTHTRPFFHLNRLRRNDVILVRTRAGTYRYRVYAARIVRPIGRWVLNGHRTRRLVLTTCHPRFSARYRLVVFAEQVVKTKKKSRRRR